MKNILKNLGKGILVLVSVLLCLLIIGTFWPQLVLFGQIGTIMTSFWNLHFLIIGLIILAVSIWLICKHSSFINKTLLVINILIVVGSATISGSQISTAHKYGTKINWGQYLTGKVDMGVPDEKTSIVYSQSDKKLKMQITMPTKKTSINKPVFLIHGGGYMAGSRNQQPSWTKYYASHGYVVFDVDYHLASKTQHPWKQAPTDIALAIKYVQKHASRYNVDMNKMVIAGSSAGGGVALQTAYGIADNTIAIKGLPIPRAVVAIYPGSDPYALWYGNSSLFGMKGNICDKYYIGGSPDQYPKRYASVAPAQHITKNTPATLIVAGTSDHVIPYQGHQELTELLSEKGIDNKLVTLPMNDHFFDMAGGSIGSQIARQQATNFLEANNK